MIQVKRMSHATFETPDLERQIDYFTQIVGLTVAARENGRAQMATKVGDLVVTLAKADQARCAGLSFQVDPDTEFGDIKKGLEAEGVRCETGSQAAGAGAPPAAGATSMPTPRVAEPVADANSAQREEEETMLAEAGRDDHSAPRRDPEEVALELLQNELGARRIEG